MASSTFDHQWSMQYVHPNIPKEVLALALITVFLHQRQNARQFR